VLRLLLIFALVAATGSTPRPAAPSADPLVLVGWWREAATGQIVVIDPSRLEVRDPRQPILGPTAATEPSIATATGAAAGKAMTAANGAGGAARVGQAAGSVGAAGAGPPAGAATAAGRAPGAGPAGGAATSTGAAAPGVSGGDRVAEGSWVGDNAGRFLVWAYGLPAGASALVWLSAAAGFAVDGADRVLLDRAGNPVARLVPAAAGVVAGAADPARPPSDLEHRASAPRAPLPAGLRPVDDLTGRWVPVEQPGPGGAFVQFAADGTWTGSDSCTGTGGSWLAAPDGAFLATATTVMTFVACPGVGVAHQVGAARVVGLDGSILVLLDADGGSVGRYQRG
jgi:hypothetical protein